MDGPGPLRAARAAAILPQPAAHPPVLQLVARIDQPVGSKRAVAPAWLSLAGSEGGRAQSRKHSPCSGQAAASMSRASAARCVPRIHTHRSTHRSMSTCIVFQESRAGNREGQDAGGGAGPRRPQQHHPHRWPAPPTCCRASTRSISFDLLRPKRLPPSRPPDSAPRAFPAAAITARRRRPPAAGDRVPAAVRAAACRIWELCRAVQRAVRPLPCALVLAQGDGAGAGKARKRTAASE